MSDWFDAIVNKKIIGVSHGGNFLSLHFDDGKTAHLKAIAHAYVTEDGRIKIEPEMVVEVGQ